MIPQTRFVLVVALVSVTCGVAKGQLQVESRATRLHQDQVDQLNARVRHLTEQIHDLKAKTRDLMRDLRRSGINLNPRLSAPNTTILETEGRVPTQDRAVPQVAASAPSVNNTAEHVSWNVTGVMLHPDGGETAGADSGVSTEPSDIESAQASPEDFMHSRLEKRYGMACKKLSKGSVCGVSRDAPSVSRRPASAVTKSDSVTRPAEAANSQVARLLIERSSAIAIQPDFKTLLGEILKRAILNALDKPIKIGEHGKIGLRTTDVVAEVRGLQFNDGLLAIDFEANVPFATVLGLDKAGEYSLEGSFLGHVSGLLKVDAESVAADTLNVACTVEALKVAIDKPSFPRLPLPERIAIEVPKLRFLIVAKAASNEISLAVEKPEAQQPTLSDEPPVPPLFHWIAAAGLAMNPMDEVVHRLVVARKKPVRLMNARALFAQMYRNRESQSVFAVATTFFAQQSFAANDRQHPVNTESPKEETPIVVKTPIPSPDKIVPHAAETRRKVINHPEKVKKWVERVWHRGNPFKPGFWENITKTKVIREAWKEVVIEEIKEPYDEIIRGVDVLTDVEIGTVTYHTKSRTWRDPSEVDVQIQSITYSQEDGTLEVPFAIHTQEHMEYELVSSFSPRDVAGVDTGSKTITLVGNAVVRASGSGTFVVREAVELQGLSLQIEHVDLGVPPQDVNWGAVAFGKEVPLPPLSPLTAEALRDLVNIYLESWGGNGALSKKVENAATDALKKWREDVPNVELVELNEENDAGFALRSFVGEMLRAQLVQGPKTPESGEAASRVTFKDPSQVKVSVETLDLFSGTSHGLSVTVTGPIQVVSPIPDSVPAFLKPLLGNGEEFKISGDAKITANLDFSEKLEEKENGGVQATLTAKVMQIEMTNVLINEKPFAKPIGLKPINLYGRIRISRQGKSAEVTGDFSDEGLVMTIGDQEVPLKKTKVSTLINEALKDVSFDLSPLVVQTDK